MRPLAPLAAVLLLALAAAGAAAATCTTAAALIRSQFDRFVVLQRRGPPKRVIMPFYTAYIAALDAFIADRAFCPNSFGPCCLEQREVDNFHAIHDRSLVDAKIAALRAVDSNLFYLPADVLSDSQLPALTPAQTTEVDLMWRVTQEALEDRPDSYFSIWSVLPEGLNMLYDPHQSQSCAQFQKFKNGAPTADLITSVKMVHKVAAVALHARILGAPEADAIQLLFHAATFIFNGIRCEKKQNEQLMVPPFYYTFYVFKMRKVMSRHGLSHTSIPPVPVDAIEKSLADQLRVLSSYQSWGRVEHLVSNGVSTSKRNIKQDIFSAKTISKVLKYMLHHTSMTDVQRANILTRTAEAEISFQTTVTLSSGQWAMPLALVSSQSLTFVYRQTVECTTELFHSYPNPTPTALSDCCANLCDNANALSTLSPPLTKSECCGYCNEADCDVENPPLSNLSEELLLPYYDDGSETVNL